MKWILARQDNCRNLEGSDHDGNENSHNVPWEFHTYLSANKFHPKQNLKDPTKVKQL